MMETHLQMLIVELVTVRREQEAEWSRIFCSVSTAEKSASTARTPSCWNSSATRVPVAGTHGWVTLPTWTMQCGGGGGVIQEEILLGYQLAVPRAETEPGWRGPGRRHRDQAQQVGHQGLQAHGLAPRPRHALRVHLQQP